MAPSRIYLLVVAAAWLGLQQIWVTGISDHDVRVTRPLTFSGTAGGGGPKMPNMGDLLGAMPKVMEATKKLRDSQESLKNKPVVGTGAGGRVKVTVTGSLTPVSVEIDEALMTELSAEELGDELLAAMKEAHTGSLELAKTSLSEIYGSMGLPVPGQEGSAPGPAPAKPKTEPLNFDPLGLGGDSPGDSKPGVQVVD